MSKYTPQKKHQPIDADVQLPAAIRAASARASEIHKAAYLTVEEAAEQEQAQQEQEAAQQEQAQQEQEPAQQEPAQQEPAKQAQKPAEPDTWEHKYNSMKGRYDQQVSTVRDLNTRIAQLENLLATAQAQKPAPAAHNPDLTFKPISAEEREAFGDDFIDVSRRAAMEQLSPEIQRLNQQIAELKGQVGKVATTTQRATTENMYTTLDRELTNWREINRDPNFIGWANLPDPYSGVIRLKLMREAFEQGDAVRVLRFFRGFLSDEAATDPAKALKPDNTPTGKVPLEQLAAPGRAKTSAASVTQAPDEKETITRAQIAQFYSQKAQGYYKGNEAEMNELEARIFAAQRDGRII